MPPLQAHCSTPGTAAPTRESGQVVVLLLTFLVVLLGMAAFAIDVGSWYRADRALQSSVDAAALAAAQALPDDPGGAGAQAAEYGEKNGGGLDTVSVTTAVVGNDTVVVTGKRDAPGFFSKIFGLDSVEVHARAAARAGTLKGALGGAVRWRRAAPDAPVPADPLLRAGHVARPRQGRPRSLPDHQHRRLARRDRPLDAGRLDHARLRGLHAARLVLLRPGLFPNKLNGYFKRVVSEGIGSQSAGSPSFGARAVSLVE